MEFIPNSNISSYYVARRIQKSLLESAPTKSTNNTVPCSTQITAQKTTPDSPTSPRQLHSFYPPLPLRRDARHALTTSGPLAISLPVAAGEIEGITPAALFGAIVAILIDGETEGPASGEWESRREEAASFQNRQSMANSMKLKTVGLSAVNSEISHPMTNLYRWQLRQDYNYRLDRH